MKSSRERSSMCVPARSRGRQIVAPRTEWRRRLATEEGAANTRDIERCPACIGRIRAEGHRAAVEAVDAAMIGAETLVPPPCPSTTGRDSFTQPGRGCHLSPARSSFRRRHLVTGDRSSLFPARSQQPRSGLINDQRIVGVRTAPQECIFAILYPAREHHRTREPIDLP